jgi:hypothetical protein
MTDLRGLSMTQPWATLAAIEAKQWETRSWATMYRGWVALHAAKAMPRYAVETLQQPWFRAVLIPYARQIGATTLGEALPRGAILAVAWLEECVPTTEVLARGISVQEQTFGDYASGRFAFRLTNVRRLAQPIVWKGALGLWRVPPVLATQIREAA